MMVFAMPSLGADMEEGKLVEWLVKPGDRVDRGDIVAVVETQKGAIEIEIFEAGVVTELLARPGETLPVGAPLARIEPVGEAVCAPPADPVPAAAPPPAASAPPPPIPAPAYGPGGAVLASPAARARAAELGIALERIEGSGPGGAVLLSDLDDRAAARVPPPEPPRSASPAKPGLDLAEMRRAIAAAMARSKRDIPHYYLSHEIDLHAAQAWLSAANANRTPDRRLLMGALLLRATVRALARVPELNGRHEGEPYAPSTAVHCGLAVAMRGGGLIAPAILDAHALDHEALMAAMRDVVARARTGRLRNSEITQGTITVSSLGDTGVDALVGVIYPPQVALVGFGTPRPKPAVWDDRVQPRLSVTATLAADHRISDGRRGALFLAEIARLLQEPESA